MNFSVSNRRLPNIEAGSTTGPIIMAVLMDDGKIYAYMSEHWYRTNEEPASSVAIAAGPGGFWCLDRAGNIHKWNEDPADSEWVLDVTAKDATTLSCDPEGNLWYTDKQGDLYVSQIASSPLGSEAPQQMGTWMKAAHESAWFFGDTWEYTAKPGDHLLKIVRGQYKVTDADVVYHIADEIVRLSKITKKRDSVKPGQTLTMPPLGYR